MNANEKRLIEANTVLVDRNRILINDLKRLARYISEHIKVESEEIKEIVSYYENYKYY